MKITKHKNNTFSIKELSEKEIILLIDNLGFTLVDHADVQDEFQSKTEDLFGKLTEAAKKVSIAYRKIWY